MQAMRKLARLLDVTPQLIVVCLAGVEVFRLIARWV